MSCQHDDIGSTVPKTNAPFKDKVTNLNLNDKVLLGLQGSEGAKHEAFLSAFSHCGVVPTLLRPSKNSPQLIFPGIVD